MDKDYVSKEKRLFVHLPTKISYQSASFYNYD